MKKNLLTLTAVVIALVLVNQESKAQSRDVTVNVELKDVISGGGAGDGGTATGPNAVNFVFDDVDHYNTTQTQVVPDQLHVLSTKGYNITVKAQTPTFVGPTSTLPLDILKISTSKSGANTFGSEVVPTTSPQVIFSGGLATLAQSYDFKYAIAPNLALVEAAKELYKVVLTYTVVAQ